MIQSSDSGLFQSSLLAGHSSVIHGFSGRAAGDMKRETGNRKIFIQNLSFRAMPLLPRQTHSARVPGDGLVSKTRQVAVFTADCVPVLLVDPEAHVCAAVHAGWKGTLGGITKAAVAAMVHEGACAEDIYAVIGPHIGSCCYDVLKDRADAFVRAFGPDERAAFLRGRRWFLDLGRVNYRQIVAVGVRAHHIDLLPVCTSCQNDKFFSYRRDSRETHGEMMAVIGFI